MQYYFEDIEKQEKLKKILDEWLNTPFRHHCGVKGLGCDCIHFVVRVLEEIGLLKWHKNIMPDYPRDWHLHNTRELLAEGLEKELDIKKVSLNRLKNGDIILFHYGKAASHAGIYYDEHVYQSITNVGVCSIHFQDRKMKQRMKFAYRIIK